MANKLIPAGTTGKNTDLQATINLATPDAAISAFDQAAERLLNPSVWHQLCGKASATFELMGSGQEPVHRKIIEGDYIRINIPGPGPGAGDGYDWVQVTMVHDSPTTDTVKQIGIKLVPCSNPQEPQTAAAHFFDKGASSTLIIRQQNTTVTATYHGRNETINNHTNSLTDNIRNTAIAIGAKAGLSELQWSKLIHAFLETKEESTL